MPHSKLVFLLQALNIRIENLLKLTTLLFKLSKSAGTVSEEIFCECGNKRAFLSKKLYKSLLTISLDLPTSKDIPFAVDENSFGKKKLKC